MLGVATPRTPVVAPLALTLPNINRFSQLFHYQNQEKICNNTITKCDENAFRHNSYSALLLSNR